MIETEDIAKLEEKKFLKPFQVEKIESFIFDESGSQHDWEGYGVTLKKDPANYCWLMRDKMEADNLCEFLNNEAIFDIDNSIDAFVLDNCIEWSNLVTELTYKEIKLYKAKEAYEKASEKLLEDAAKTKEKTGEDIIKARYGGNNDKTRKKYVKENLSKDKQAIKTLEFSIDYCKRRISYLKGLVTVKTALMEAKNE